MYRGEVHMREILRWVQLDSRKVRSSIGKSIMAYVISTGRSEGSGGVYI